MTISGPDAALVAWSMFKGFWKFNADSLPRAFDTNIYCLGHFVASEVQPSVADDFVALNDSNLSAYVPKHNQHLRLIAATAKVVLTRRHVSSNIDNLISKMPLLYNVMTSAEQWCDMQKKRFAKALALTKRNFAKLAMQSAKSSKHKAGSQRSKKIKRPERPERPERSSNAEGIELYTRYKLQCKFGQKALEYVYKTASHQAQSPQQAAQCLNNIMTASYFAVEAYYTPDAVNVVVLSLQRKDKEFERLLEPVSFLCTSLECLGDFRHHVLSELDSDVPRSSTAILACNSKYVFRILYCLEKLQEMCKPREAAKKPARKPRTSRRSSKKSSTPGISHQHSHISHISQRGLKSQKGQKSSKKKLHVAFTHASTRFGNSLGIAQQILSSRLSSSCSATPHLLQSYMGFTQPCVLDYLNDLTLFVLERIEYYLSILQKT